MYNTHEEIDKLEKLIQRNSIKRESKIENANYILAMQLNRIRNGELKSIEDIVKWDFDMIKMGELVGSMSNKKDSIIK